MKRGPELGEALFRTFTTSESPSYLSDVDVLVSHNDTLAFLRTVPDGLVRLVVSSPPYNIGKPYERKRALGDYLDWQAEVLEQCVRVLQDGGSLCWQVGNYVDSGEIVPLDAMFYPLLKDRFGLKLRNRIIWQFEHGLHARNRLSGRYEVILWFTKGDDYLFNLDSIRVPQKYPGKLHHKGPHRGTPSGNPLGKNPGDMWSVLEQDWDSLIWDIPNVKNNHTEKTEHPAQFPIELVERLVLALSSPGEIVLDPFAGAGSTLVASLLHERRAIGVDIERAYVDITLERLAALRNGTLRHRVLGTAKYEPNGCGKLARRPAEWDSERSAVLDPVPALATRLPGIAESVPEDYEEEDT
jgi:adenine-specific DNA-methyltransferase